MKRFFVETNTDKNAKLFLELMKELKFVKNVEAIEPLTEDDWIRPGRPATEEELEKYTAEAEKGPFYNVEESKAATYKKIKKWAKKNRK